MTNTNRIPMPQSPVVDLKTGFATIPWYRYLNQPNFQNVTLNGVIAVVDGGTGLASGTPGALLFFNSAQSIASLPIGPAGYVVTSVNGAPAWSPGSSSLPPNGVAQGTYGDFTHVPVLTIDATGRVTTASSLKVANFATLPTSILVGSSPFVYQNTTGFNASVIIY